MILRAPFIFPIDRPPIPDGALVTHEDRIVALGPYKEILADYHEKDPFLIDLADSALLPGFVNAHSHLELTALKGLAYPGNFSEWIRKVVDLKPKLSEKDYQKGLQEGILWMLQSGITTVGDHVSFNSDLEAIVKSPLRGILFVEVLGVVKEVAEGLLEAAEELERLFNDEASRFQVTASPHSVHAVHREILPKLFKPERAVLSIHLSESEDEEHLFHENKGPLYDLIAEKNVGAIRESPLRGSCIQYLEHQGLLSPQVMAVHGNYLDETDMKLLARHEISVVHCPTSHAYFSHRPFPLRDLLEKGINIALGTDSLASGESLSMLDEIREVRREYPQIEIHHWFEMATLGGARALKMEKEIGTLTPGKKADLIALPLKGRKKPPEALEEILHAPRVHFVMIDGKVIS